MRNSTLPPELATLARRARGNGHAFTPRTASVVYEERHEWSDEAWLERAETVGLTSGASAPERLVTRVCDWFRARGVHDIGEFARVTEDVFFRLPIELRRAQSPVA